MSNTEDKAGGSRGIGHHSSRYALWIAIASYFSQGLVYGVLSTILIPTLAGQGVSLEQQVGIVGSGLIAWTFKSIWAPLIDRFFRHAPSRSPNLSHLIVLIQFVLAGTLFLIAHQTEFDPLPLSLAFVWFLVNILVSIQDSATDAWTIDSIRPQHHGRASAWLMTGRQFGYAVLTSFGLGQIARKYGLANCFEVAASILLAVGLLMIAFAILRSKQPSNAQGRIPEIATSISLKEFGYQLANFFKAQPLRQGLLVAFVAWLPNGAISGAAPNFLFQRAQWSIADYQAQIVPSAAICGTLAFLCSTWLVQKIGVHRLMVVGSSALGATWTALGCIEPWWTVPSTLLTYVWFEATATSLFMVGLYAWYMGLVSSKVRATQFVLLMSALNLSEYFGISLSPKMFAALDYQGLWWTCGTLQLILSGYLILVWKGHTSRMSKMDANSPE